MGPLIPLISIDTPVLDCPWLQNQSGSLPFLCHLYAIDSSDSPLVRHLLTSWRHSPFIMFAQWTFYSNYKLLNLKKPRPYKNSTVLEFRYFRFDFISILYPPLYVISLWTPMTVGKWRVRMVRKWSFGSRCNKWVPVGQENIPRTHINQDSSTKVMAFFVNQKRKYKQFHNMLSWCINPQQLIQPVTFQWPLYHGANFTPLKQEIIFVQKGNP